MPQYRSPGWTDRYVAARLRQARDHPSADRVARSAKTIGMTDVACFAAATARFQRDNDIDFELDELGRDLGEARRNVTERRWPSSCRGTRGLPLPENAPAEPAGSGSTGIEPSGATIA